MHGSAAPRSMLESRRSELATLVGDEAPRGPETPDGVFDELDQIRRAWPGAEDTSADRHPGEDVEDYGEVERAQAKQAFDFRDVGHPYVIRIPSAYSSGHGHHEIGRARRHQNVFLEDASDGPFREFQRARASVCAMVS